MSTICGEEDHALQDVLICIGTGKTLEDEDRLQIDHQLYLKSGEEMAALFRHVPEAMANTVSIADRSTWSSIRPARAAGVQPLPQGMRCGGLFARRFVRTDCA